MILRKADAAQGHICKGKISHPKDVRAKNSRKAWANAQDDSNSPELENRMIDSALEQAVEIALGENERLGLKISLIATPEVYWSRSSVRKVDGAKGYQGHLTIKLNIAAYERNR